MKKIYQITFVVLACLLIAASAQARGYVVANDGICITVEFHYNADGGFIGNSISTGSCNIPNGFYPFRLTIGDTKSSTPTPLNPTTGKSLTKNDSLYQVSLQVLQVVRMADTNSSRRNNQTVTLPREYSLLIEEGLKNGKTIAVSVPHGYLSSSMVEKLQK